MAWCWPVLLPIHFGDRVCFGSWNVGRPRDRRPACFGDFEVGWARGIWRWSGLWPGRLAILRTVTGVPGRHLQGRLHRFGQATRRGHCPSGQAALKVLYLVIRAWSSGNH